MIATLDRRHSMVEKKPRGPWETRRELVTPDLLRERADVLNALASRLAEQADEIAATGSHAVRVDGAKKFAAGHELIDKFVKNVHIAMINEGLV